MIRIQAASASLVLIVLVLVWAWITDVFGLSNPMPRVLVYDSLRPAQADVPSMEADTADAGVTKVARPGAVSWNLPSGWRSEAAGGMRLATIWATVGDNPKGAEVSLIELPGAAGGMVANIHRWRGQIDLPKVSDDEVRALLQQRQSGLGPYHWCRLENPAKPEEAFLATIVQRGSALLFVKLIAPAKDLSALKPSFLALCDSLRAAGGQ